MSAAKATRRIKSLDTTRVTLSIAFAWESVYLIRTSALALLAVYSRHTPRLAFRASSPKMDEVQIKRKRIEVER
jgi:hypothetical protein